MLAIVVRSLPGKNRLRKRADINNATRYQRQMTDKKK